MKRSFVKNASFVAIAASLLALGGPVFAGLRDLRQVTAVSYSDGRAYGNGSVSAGLLRLHADQVRLVERERTLRERFATAHPQVPTAVVPALAGDVHDLEGLRRIGELLALAGRSG